VLHRWSEKRRTPPVVSNTKDRRNEILAHPQGRIRLRQSRRPTALKLTRDLVEHVVRFSSLCSIARWNSAARAAITSGPSEWLKAREVIFLINSRLMFKAFCPEPDPEEQRPPPPPEPDWITQCVTKVKAVSNYSETAIT
jgi:hypothetical protein